MRDVQRASRNVWAQCPCFADVEECVAESSSSTKRLPVSCGDVKVVHAGRNFERSILLRQNK